LSAKNTRLLNIVKTEFFSVNNRFINIDNLTDLDISILLGDLVQLDVDARTAMKDSVANVYFPQTQIDSLYTLFLNY
jgi:hypothetical protein